MKQETGQKMQRIPPAAQPQRAVEAEIVSKESLSELIRDMQQLIARRAYELYQARGQGSGKEWDDWFRAESELIPVLDGHVTDSGQRLTVRCRIPHLDSKSVKVGVQGHRVMIWGRSGRPLDSEPEKILRIDLPRQVEASEVNAQMYGELLTLDIQNISASPVA